MSMTAEQIFENYANTYDLSDGKMKLKMVHTLEVAKVMDALTDALGLNEHMKNKAHICALFHDIGRFEQLKQYNTFLDHLSVDHADFGCEIIKKDHLLDELQLSEEDKEQILKAIKNHNKYQISSEITGDTNTLCKLIRDADKSDIFRVFAEEDLVNTMGETLEQVEKETITPEVLDQFMAHQCVEKTIRKTGLDKWVGFLAFFFDIYYKETIEKLYREKKYLVQFEKADFQDEKTRSQVQLIQKELDKYIQERIGKKK